MAVTAKNNRNFVLILCKASGYIEQQITHKPPRRTKQHFFNR